MKRAKDLFQRGLTDSDFGDLTGVVMEMARQHCNSRLISLLEGGYNLEGLASAAKAHCARLCGSDP